MPSPFIPFELWAVAVAIAVATPASAATVYRCGNTYQDKPCPGATVVDAEPSKGMEVRSAGGAVVHSREGDKARNARAMEQMNENTQKALSCAVAGDAVTAKYGRLDCPTVKAQQDAKRLTPDYIKR